MPGHELPNLACALKDKCYRHFFTALIAGRPMFSFVVWALVNDVWAWIRGITIEMAYQIVKDTNTRHHVLQYFLWW